MICEVILLGGGGCYWAGGEHHAHVDRYVFFKDTFLYNYVDRHVFLRYIFVKTPCKNMLIGTI